MTTVLGKKIFYVNLRKREEAEEELAVFERGEWYTTHMWEVFEAQAKVHTHLHNRHTTTHAPHSHSLTWV